MYRYVRKTGCCLGDHFQEHINITSNNDQDKPVSRHFNLANHSLSNCCVSDISLFSGNNEGL